MPVQIFNSNNPALMRAFATSQVNANTASPQVLAALKPELMEDQKIVQEIIEARAIRPFSQPTDIMSVLPKCVLDSRKMFTCRFSKPDPRATPWQIWPALRSLSAACGIATHRDVDGNVC